MVTSHGQISENTVRMIPFIDLKAQYHSIKPEIDAAISRVLESSEFVLGKEVAAFEEEFASYCRVKHAVGVNSGTSALHLALLAAGIGSSHEVITVPFTFVATVATICHTGARPVFVDIEPESMTMNPNALEAVITDKTKAIVPVHLFGQPADMDPILEIARRFSLVVIEDAAQAHGAEYKQKRVGGIGHLGCFSFYPTKNLGAYGEGGMIVTDNPQYDSMLRLLRNWGSERRYFHDIKAFNYRMEGLQGAILRVKLKYLDAWIEARRRHAQRYKDLLVDAGVQTPQESTGTRHVYHAYAIRTAGRDALQTALHKGQVGTAIHYPLGLHMQPAYSDLGYREGQFPVTESIAKRILSLPIYAELTPLQQDTVASVLKAHQRNMRQ
jgi:dTDP-4-amino-4,6-dideoxygalactose transaminase